MVYWSKWVEGCDSDNVVVLVNLVHTMNQNGHNVNVHYSSENFSGRLFFSKKGTNLQCGCVGPYLKITFTRCYDNFVYKDLL